MMADNYDHILAFSRFHQKSYDQSQLFVVWNGSLDKVKILWAHITMNSNIGLILTPISTIKKLGLILTFLMEMRES